MTLRIALIGGALALANLTAGTAYGADPYGGFGPSSNEPAAQETGVDPGPAEAAPDASALPWLQQQSQNQPESYSGAWDRPPASGEYDMDDEGGH
jgi:hypothetical protein